MCCGGGRKGRSAPAAATLPTRGITADPAARRALDPPTTLVRYVGAAVGKQRWLGFEGRPYEFGLSNPLQQVLATDLPIFEGRSDFQVVSV